MTVLFAVKGTRLILQDSAGYDPWTPVLPQLEVDTTLPTGWDGTADVSPADSAAFQSALDGAVQNGDGIYIIQLTAGATYTGPFKFNAKAGSGWVIIRTSGYGSLPSPGTRVTDATNMAKITGTGTGAQSCGIWHEWGSHHVRYIGIEFTTTHTTTTGTATLISVGYDPDANADPSSVEDEIDHVIFDRCYIHGNATGNARQGIQFDCSYGAVIDSRIENIHEVGSDSQAVSVRFGAGPYKFDNNYLSGAGENFLIGGSDPPITDRVPADITITSNHCYKPLTWNASHGSYDGYGWTVKNNGELKNARRVLIEGNVFENCWPAGQGGYLVVITPRNQDDTAPWCAVEDVTFRLNKLTGGYSGIQLAASDSPYTSEPLLRLLVENNLLECDSDGESNRLFQCSTGSDPGDYITIEHNTAFNLTQATLPEKYLAAINIGDTPYFATNMRIKNNIFSNGTTGVFTSSGGGTTGLTAFITSYEFLNNALILDGAAPYSYHASTIFPDDAADCGFADFDGGDYTVTSGDLNNAGTDSTDIGADISALNTAISGVV